VHSEIAGVGKLTFLQRLKFKVRIVDEFDIRQLQSMSKLVTLEISQLENVKTNEQASAARLIDKEYLQELSLSWNDINVGLILVQLEQKMRLRVFNLMRTSKVYV
jgi:hypothetical protein